MDYRKARDGGVPLPVSRIPDEQVVEWVRQLPQPARADALRALLADSDWDDLLAYGSARLDDALAERGRDRGSIAPDAIDRAIDDITQSG